MGKNDMHSRGLDGLYGEARAFMPSENERLTYLSQLCVIAKLAEMDKATAQVLPQRGSDGSWFAKDLLETAEEAQHRYPKQGTGSSGWLVDSENALWRKVSADQIADHLRIVASLPGDWDAVAAELLTLSAGGGNPAIPSDICRILFALSEGSSRRLLFLSAAGNSMLDLTSSESSSIVYQDLYDRDLPTNPVESHHAFLERVAFVSDKSIEFEGMQGMPWKFEDDYIESETGNCLIASPPFGSKVKGLNLEFLPEALPRSGSWAMEEYLLVRMVQQHSGSLLVLMPAGFQAKGGRTADVRRWLVQSKRLRSVVTLPGGFGGTTAIPATLLDIGPAESAHDRVRFLEAKEGSHFQRDKREYRYSGWEQLVSALVGKSPEDSSLISGSSEEVLQGDCALRASRFDAAALNALTAVTKGRPLVPLGDLFDVFQLTPPKASKSEGVTTVKEVLISDFTEIGGVQEPSQIREIPASALRRLDNHLLSNGDVLLSARGSIGKAALYDLNPDKRGAAARDWVVASPTCLVVRPRQGSPEDLGLFLLRYLLLPEVQKYVESFATGSAIQFIRVADIRAIPVPIASKEDIDAIRQCHFEIQRLTREASQRRREAKELSNNSFDTLKAAGQ
jgi:N-6 DNA methylase